MNLKRLITSVVLALGVAAPATAQDENACRSYLSPNWAYAWDRGTATGNAHDLIAIRDCLGRIYACYTVRQWANMQGSPFINEVVVHSGGRISIRFCYFVFTSANPLIRGGSVEVISGGRVVDRDPLL